MSELQREKKEEKESELRPQNVVVSPSSNPKSPRCKSPTPEPGAPPKQRKSKKQSSIVPVKQKVPSKPRVREKEECVKDFEDFYNSGKTRRRQGGETVGIGT